MCICCRTDLDKAALHLLTPGYIKCITASLIITCLCASKHREGYSYAGPHSHGNQFNKLKARTAGWAAGQCLLWCLLKAFSDLLKRLVAASLNVIKSE